MTNTEVIKAESKVAFFGDEQKAATFRSLCQNALKYEKHAHYQDVHYLTVQNGPVECVLEFTDPGLARTGAREMAIRNADVAILFYSAHSSSSLKSIFRLKEAFDVKPRLRILVVCDTCENLEEELDTMNLSSSISEGYESDHEPIKRHYSMEQMRKGIDGDLPSSDHKTELLQALPDRSSFLEINSASKKDLDILVETIISTLQVSHVIGKRRKSVLKEILRTKSSDKDASPINRNGSDKRKGKKENADSKVCVVM